MRALLVLVTLTACSHPTAPVTPDTSRVEWTPPQRLAADTGRILYHLPTH